ncbi:hypothetical protein [Pseudogemmobacter sonorensis]|uniref:hypothetical protein n=1 Tax=Pseudogemmobacter sonorensis TaxID=2989681 RepID=UPI0036B98E4D
MIITLTPVRMAQTLTASLAGDILTLNGKAYDFTPLPEGATLPPAAVDCAWLASDVTREGGHIRLTLILPHGADAPPETLWPGVLTIASGPVPLPPHNIDQPEETAP